MWAWHVKMATQNLLKLLLLLMLMMRNVLRSYFGKQSPTLGSFVPLAMFGLSSCKSLRQRVVSMSARSNTRKKQQGVVSLLQMKLTRKTDSTWQTNKQLETDDDFKKCNYEWFFRRQMSTNWVYNWHNILNCCPPFCFLQALATLLAFRFFPRAPWTLLPSKFFVPSCNSLPVFGWLQWVNAPTMVKYNTLTVSDNLIFWESLFGQRGKL